MSSVTSHDGDGNTQNSPETSTPSNTSFLEYRDVSEFLKKLMAAVLQATKASNELPSEDAYEYFTTFDTVRCDLDGQARRLLQLMQSVMSYNSVKGNITGSEHSMEVDQQYEAVVDANDLILERIGIAVDEATGVQKKVEQKLCVDINHRRNPALPMTFWNRKTTVGPGLQHVRVLTADVRPQVKYGFHVDIDNSNRPFRPTLQTKPHAILSLAGYIDMISKLGMSPLKLSSVVVMYPHPYRHELENWTLPADQLEPVTQKVPIPLVECSAEFIDTSEHLARLCEELQCEKEIAVDLEHHSERSFQGFCCLIQLSTRHRDYIINSMALRHELQHFNTVFANPGITKVFHGADNDVSWLQRDFGLYVVNMFDTHQAARILRPPGSDGRVDRGEYSLANLLSRYCQVTADKQYQTADWRFMAVDAHSLDRAGSSYRDSLLTYAQQDTHYLLYIYDCMRNELVAQGNTQRNLMHAVYNASRNVCLTVYKKPCYTPASYRTLYANSRKRFNPQQLLAFMKLHHWRDSLAREKDESTQYVLPNHYLLNLAENLPREKEGVLAICGGLRGCPHLLRQHLMDIHTLLCECIDSVSVPMVVVKEEQSTVKCKIAPPAMTIPHDLSHKAAPVISSVDVRQSGGGVSECGPSSRDRWGTGDVGMEVRAAAVKIWLDVPAILRPVSVPGSTSKAERIVRSFVNPMHRFLPGSLTADLPSKPSLPGSKVEAVWRLKPPTNPPSNKRKSDVDLDSFSPEFCPPTDRKVKNMPQTTPPDAVGKVEPCTSEQNSSVVRKGAFTATETEIATKLKEIRQAISSHAEKAMSMNQMIKMRKKARKKERCREKVSSACVDVCTPQPSSALVLGSGEGGGQSVLGEVEADHNIARSLGTDKRNVNCDQSTLACEGTPVTETVAEPVNPAIDTLCMQHVKHAQDQQGLPRTTAGTSAMMHGGHDRKKKKKKNKTYSGDIINEVTPFDYSAADTSSLTGKIKKEIDPDIFDPRGRHSSGFKGRGSRVKKRKGGKSGGGASGGRVRSMTFTAGRGKKRG